MGFLRKKEESEELKEKLNAFKNAVIVSFNNVKRDISLQSQWINHIHRKHIELEATHGSHKTLTSEELRKIKLWINHLNETNKQHSRDIEALKNSITNAFNTYNKHIIELYKESQREKIDLAAIKEQIKSEIKPEIEALIKEHRDTTNKHLAVLSEKIDNIPHIKEIQMVPKPSLLTYPEQKLLNLLLEEPDPITYEQIANKTGHSINTIRVIMNSLKKRNLIDEHLLPSGVKLFNAKNKEKIKKLYNLTYI
ncbi:MAG: winged helix-turn-helix domain-containing protein [Candidatus Woesearchaeota archaeon]